MRFVVSNMFHDDLGDFLVRLAQKAGTLDNEGFWHLACALVWNLDDCTVCHGSMSQEVGFKLGRSYLMALRIR